MLYFLPRRLFLVGCGLTSLLAGCGDPPASPQSFSANPEQRGIESIVTTCGMVTDIVRAVAGEHAEVTGLMSEGVDPHLYKPTRGDVKQLNEADLVFYSGLMLEGRMADTFLRIQRSGTPAYPITEAIDESNLREPPEFEGHWDPHVWMDIELWSTCVGYVATVLSQEDPEHAAAYRQNADTLQTKLKDLDAYVKSAINSIPDGQRILITAHDAFGYFAQAYGITVRAPQGLSTESSAGVQDIVELVDFIVDNEIKAIFVESSVSEENIKALIEAAASKNWTVKIGGELFADAMGAPGTYTGTYIGMMDHNATVIARALGGEAPENGFQGNLNQ